MSAAASGRTRRPRQRAARIQLIEKRAGDRLRSYVGKCEPGRGTRGIAVSQTNGSGACQRWKNHRNSEAEREKPRRRLRVPVPRPRILPSRSTPAIFALFARWSFINASLGPHTNLPACSRPLQCAIAHPRNSELRRPCTSKCSAHHRGELHLPCRLTQIDYV